MPLLFGGRHVPAILLHFGAQPALQAGAQGWWKIAKLDPVMSGLIGPCDSSGKLNSIFIIAVGNRKDQQHRGAGFQRFLGIRPRSTGADIEQDCIELFSGKPHLDRQLDLGAIVTLLIEAQAA
jgi:hypothetical protein